VDWTHQVVGNTYELLGPIGHGGVGTVYKADVIAGSRAGEVAAVKIMPIDGEDSREISFLLREAYEYSRLDHAAIPRFYDFGKANATSYFLAMAYVRGESLRSYVTRNGSIAETSLSLIAAQVLRALEYVNSRELLHRDVKPANILLDLHGDAILVDFGMAKRQEDRSITIHELEVKGTPGYLSPEQIAADPDLDARTDVFSLGCTLYYAAAGHPPFAGETPAHTCSAVLHEEPPPLIEVANVTPQFHNLIVRMMTKDFHNRPFPSELKGKFIDLAQSQS
jgi:serine/threonine-protein kinase